MTLRCFACEQDATSREHAPPLCIFPAASDTEDGTSYRTNLITVPACDDHNLKKSKDDEYLMMILVAHYENNPLANTQMKSKVVRAWQRRPHLATMAVQNPVPARLNGEATMVFQIDSARFNRAMELIARAVIFHETGCRWLGSAVIWSPSMLPSDPATAQDVMKTSQSLIEALPHIFAGKPMLGSNPEVFQYRILVPEPPATIGCVQFLFYGGLQVCALLNAGTEA